MTISNTSNATKVFLLLGFLFGVLWVFLTPPFQVADEPNHFFRAWQVSQGGIFPEVQNGHVGGQLPASVIHVADTLEGYLKHHPEQRVSAPLVQSALQEPVRPNDLQFADFPNIAVYSPVGYLGSALGILFGRALSLNVLACFWLGRLANFLLTLAITAFAIEIAPGWKWTLCLLSLAPMTVYQRSSVSPDALNNALAILILAFSLSLALDDRRSYEGLTKWTFISAGVALSLCKISYVFLPALGFWAGKRSNFHKGKLRELFTYGLISAPPTLLWTIYARRLPITWRTDAHQQMASLLHQPVSWLLFVAKTIWHFRANLIGEWAGGFGWLEFSLPPQFSAVFAIVCVLILLVDQKQKLDMDFRTALASIGVASIYMIALPIFLTWSPLGSPFLDGLQGRYFIPIAPFLLIAMTPKPSWDAKVDLIKIAAKRHVLGTLAPLFFLVTATLTIFTHYYGG